MTGVVPLVAVSVYAMRFPCNHRLLRVKNAFGFGFVQEDLQTLTKVPAELKKSGSQELLGLHWVDLTFCPHVLRSSHPKDLLKTFVKLTSPR